MNLIYTYKIVDEVSGGIHIAVRVSLCIPMNHLLFLCTFTGRAFMAKISGNCRQAPHGRLSSAATQSFPLRSALHLSFNAHHSPFFEIKVLLSFDYLLGSDAHRTMEHESRTAAFTFLQSCLPDFLPPDRS